MLLSFLNMYFCLIFLLNLWAFQRSEGGLRMVSLYYYHGCLGVTEAESRLRDLGEDGAYLLRESDVKGGGRTTNWH